MNSLYRCSKSIELLGICCLRRKTLLQASFQNFGVRVAVVGNTRTASHNVHAVTSRRIQKEKSFDPVPWFLLVIPVSTFCLGTWQVYRRTWKLKLIEDLEARTNHPPVPFPEDLKELESMEYRKVVVKGTFDHSKELYLGPRTRLVDGEGASRGGTISRDLAGQTGVHVVTPFHLSDRNLTILVNRGWVPMKKKNPGARKQGQTEDEIELVGYVRLNETRPPFMPRNQPELNSWYYKDLPAMADIVGSEPVLLDACSSVHNGPVGGQTKISLRNEHLSYIFTCVYLYTRYMWVWRYQDIPITRRKSVKVSVYLVTGYSLSGITAWLWYWRYILKRPLL